jgi:hypothetical protein
MYYDLTGLTCERRGITGVSRKLGGPKLEEATNRNDLRWMSLNEALKHIESILNAGSVSAQVALKEKIGAGEIPVKWADSEPPRDTPDIRELAVSQLILLEPGFASDGWSYRPLLVLRSAVQ